MDQFKRIASFVLALVMVVLMAPVQFITANAADQEVSISFADKQFRTVYTSEQQVWEQNGVTVTNDKAASNTAIADYAKPARFYANSKLTVAYPGMTEIVFVCNTATYATDFNSSIVAQEGVTTAVDAKNVTVTFATPVDSFVVEKLVKQVRMDAITISSGTAAEPTEPQETTAPQETEPAAPSVDVTVVDAPDVGAAYKFGMVQGNVENKLFFITGAMDGYYMATTEDAAAAADVYLEETEGGYGYYLCAMVDGAKQYINMVVSGTHVNGAYEAYASTVYEYDAEAGTVIATVEDAPYWFGTRNDKTYTTAGPCKTEYEGFYCKFYVISENSETPEETTAPTEPSTEATTAPTEPAGDIYNVVEGQNMTIELGNTEEITNVTFKYSIGDGTMNLALMTPSNTDYYGYFAFNRYGNVDIYDGVTVENISDNTCFVTLDIASLTKYTGNPNGAVNSIYVRGNWTDTNGIIFDVKASGASVPEATEPSVEPSVPSETTPSEPAAQVTISFADKANRVSQDTEKQVWAQNGIHVINEKGKSITNVADYANPARFYKNSMLSVSYPGMTQIVFNCASADYSAALKNSIVLDSNTIATGDGAVLTVTFASPVDTFTVESLTGGQVRVNSITVYTGEVEIPEATEPEATQPTEPEVVEIVDIATAVAGAANEKFAVKGVVTVVDSSNYYVQDATGAICVRLAEKTAEISLGDTIIGTGTKSVYNGMPQLQNATYEMSSGMKLVAKETTVDALTAADICTYVTIKGLTVTEVNDNNGQYTTPNISTVDAAGNPIQIYKAVVAKDGDAWAIKVGDVIDVTAGVGCYKDTLQLRNTLSTEIVLAETGAEPDAPVDPSEPEATEPTAPSEPEETQPTAPSEEPTAPSEEPTEPANPAGPAIVEKPVAGTAYKFGMAQGNLENKVYYLVGGMNGYYMATTEDATAALDVYLEETDGGYYLYAMVDGAKQYINMVVSGTHVNGAYEAEASTVYTYDAEAGTVVATVEDAPYWFGTRNDKTYTTVGPCKVEYEGFYCRFYTVSEGGETPSEPEATQPTEPEATQPTEPEATQPTEPATPAGPAIVEKPVAGTAYKFGMAQGNLENKLYYLVGGMNGYYMATTEDATAALDVYLEETDGGYYLYAMVDGAKQYINMVVSGTHVNGAYEATASTVYTYDAEAKTVIASVDGVAYWHGTRNDKTYTTVGPCKVEYEGFYCQFYTVSEGGEDPSEPEETKPTEPEETKPTEPDTNEIVDIATALAGAEGTQFTVKGVVTAIDSSNYYVQDATGAICVRLASKTTEIALGDTIIGTGTKSVYNGMPQLQSATYELSSGMKLAAKETTVSALTVADICTYVTIKGLTVTEIYDNNGQYTNPNVTTVDAEGNTIQIYKATVAKNGDTWAIQVGDVIDVTAAVGYHVNKFQLRNTLASEIVLADNEPTEPPAEPGDPSDPVTLVDFNGDGMVTDADAVYLLRHTLFAEEFPITLDGDVNGDGLTTDADAVYLLRYTLFPEEFPLKK